MKTIIALIVMLAASTHSFASSCVPVEYSELKDMDKAEISELYCKTYKTFLSEADFTIEQVKQGGSAFNKNEEICHDMVRKIERVYKNRFKENPDCKKVKP